MWLGNVVVRTDSLKKQFKNLWHENPQNPSQIFSNSFILHMAAERMKFSKSLRDCELWCRKERGKRVPILMATSKSPVIDTWSPYYKRLSIYGQLEDLNKKFPIAQPLLQQEVTNVSLSSYEILCKYLEGLHATHEFAKSVMQQCNNSIVEK